MTTVLIDVDNKLLLTDSLGINLYDGKEVSRDFDFHKVWYRDNNILITGAGSVDSIKYITYLILSGLPIDYVDLAVERSTVFVIHYNPFRIDLYDCDGLTRGYITPDDVGSGYIVALGSGAVALKVDNENYLSDCDCIYELMDQAKELDDGSGGDTRTYHLDGRYWNEDIM